MGGVDSCSDCDGGDGYSTDGHHDRHVGVSGDDGGHGDWDLRALLLSPGLVREQEAGLLQFLRLDGFSVLMRAMQQQVQKLKVKSAFLLQNLLVGHPEHKGTLCSMGMVQQLVALVRTEHSPFHEHVLGALCSLVTDFPQGVRECREPELGLEELLRHRCQLLQQHEEYQEELEFCEKLLQTCFSSPTDDSMDR